MFGAFSNNTNWFGSVLSEKLNSPLSSTFHIASFIFCNGRHQFPRNILGSMG